jgi:hypothetical protein
MLHLLFSSGVMKFRQFKLWKMNGRVVIAARINASGDEQFYGLQGDVHQTHVFQPEGESDMDESGPGLASSEGEGAVSSFASASGTDNGDSHEDGSSSQVVKDTSLADISKNCSLIPDQARRPYSDETRKRYILSRYRISIDTARKFWGLSQVIRIIILTTK